MYARDLVAGEEPAVRGGDGEVAGSGACEAIRIWLTTGSWGPRPAGRITATWSKRLGERGQLGPGEAAVGRRR